MPFPELHPSLLQALTARGYTEPTPVQEAVLEPEAAARDLLVSAQTGSGKTVAYGLAMNETLLAGASHLERAKKPLALIVSPTRELALQVQTELTWLYASAGARVICCVGGMDARREQRALETGAHIVVGTPGRLADHLNRGYLKLDDIRVVVLDEADEMLDFGFREELELLLKATPPERRTLMFSATLPKAILGLARQYQQDALRLALSAENAPHADIEYRAFLVGPRDTEHAVVNALRFVDAQGAIVFCSTRDAVRRLHASLQERGFSAVALSGELSQFDRTTALQALRDGRARVCVATDVAARGLDMPDLGLVIHADLPQNKQMLLHRSGRTGRAGHKGLSVMIVPVQHRGTAERLLGAGKITAVWSPAPSAESIHARDEENLVREIVAMADSPAEEDLAAGRTLLEQATPEQIAAVLVRIRRERLPAPEVLEDASTFKRSAKPAKGSYAGKKPFGAKKPFGSKPSFGAKKSFGDKLGFGDKKSFGDKKPFAAGKSFGAGKPFEDRKTFGAKKPFTGGKSFGGEKNFAAKKPFGAENSFGVQDPSVSRESFGVKDLFGARKPFGAKKPYTAKTGSSPKEVFGGTKAFGGKKPFGAKKTYGKKKIF
jgi:ATP-dependent RNA helicase DeaD